MKDRPLNSQNEPTVSKDDNADGSEGPRLISVDELRSAGALAVPAAWRKSLGAETGLFADVLEDDSAPPLASR